jgi:hypothetical protein
MPHYGLARIKEQLIEYRYSSDSDNVFTSCKTWIQKL